MEQNTAKMLVITTKVKKKKEKKQFIFAVIGFIRNMYCKIFYLDEILFTDLDDTYLLTEFQPLEEPII